MIFESRVRIEKQSKLSKIVATTLTWRDNTGPDGVAASVPILPPGDFCTLYPDVFPPFLLFPKVAGRLDDLVVTLECRWCWSWSSNPAVVRFSIYYYCACHPTMWTYLRKKKGTSCWERLVWLGTIRSERREEELISSRDKNARHGPLWGGERRARYIGYPGSELRLGGRKKLRSKMINGMGWGKVELSPLRLLTRKNINNKMRTLRTERSTILDANRWLAKIQELHALRKQPGRRMLLQMNPSVCVMWQTLLSYLPPQR